MVNGLEIPSINSLPRVHSKRLPNRDERRQATYILKTRPHLNTHQKGYLILTDRLKCDALERLRQHHDGTILTVQDLSYPQSFRQQIQRTILEQKPRYVAIAPRISYCGELMLLGILDVLLTCGSHSNTPQLEVQPSFLIASNDAAFVKLIDQSIQYSTKPANPITICQVRSHIETRSLQKSIMLRRYFEDKKLKSGTPIIALYEKSALENGAPMLEPDASNWTLLTDNELSSNTSIDEHESLDPKCFKSFPNDAQKALSDSNLWILHGHGRPGMSCSIDVDALDLIEMTSKVILAGSCYSAAPLIPNVPPHPSYSRRISFVHKAIDRGAVCAFGHLRQNTGFPHLFPILEHLIQDGSTIGEAYQRLINAIIAIRGFHINDFQARVQHDAPNGDFKFPQNALLYIMIGDPALKLFHSN